MLLSEAQVILGVSSSDQVEVKQAWRKAVLVHHPDRGGDPAAFRQLEEAYRVLLFHASWAGEHSEHQEPYYRRSATPRGPVVQAVRKPRWKFWEVIEPKDAEWRRGDVITASSNGQEMRLRLVWRSLWFSGNRWQASLVEYL